MADTLTAEQRKYRADKERERQRAKQYATRLAGRDIGTIASIADPQRRESCRYDLKRFAMTYNPKPFYLDFSEYHRQAIKRLEEAVLQGAIYAYAMPRGGGKTILAKVAAWWAISYAHRRYAFIIGATNPKADGIISSLKLWFNNLPEYAADFPEICQAIRVLDNIAHRANAQTCKGHSTNITWARNELVLPTIRMKGTGLEDFPRDVLLGDRANTNPALCLTSGSIIGASGLTGEGIRGSVKTTIEGEEIRPDLVLGDDPQTDESARSVEQNKVRYNLMTGAVLGMAGPDKTISMVVPCTKIKRGDMVDRILDRTSNPIFRGTCTGILSNMPPNMIAWEKYLAVYEFCALQEPPDYTDANKHFLEHQEILCEGVQPTWNARFKPHEVNAVQSAMHLYHLDAESFFAEYMNDPLSGMSNAEFLTADEIMRKQHELPRGRVPLEAEKITAFCDVQMEIIYWGIVAWSNEFDGFVIDYGTFPKQQRVNFEKKAIPIKLSTLYPKLNPDARTYKALEETTALLLEKTYKREGDGMEMRIDRLGIDRGFKKIVVHKFIRNKQEPRLQSCRGGKWTAKTKPMNHPDYHKKWTSEGRELGPHWRRDVATAAVRPLESDPNFWKTFVHERLATSYGDAGSLTLFHVASRLEHALFASHLKAEYCDTVESQWGKINEWAPIPTSPDNDYLDVLYNCAVLASMEGITTVGVESDAKAKTRRQLNMTTWGRVKRVE